MRFAKRTLVFAGVMLAVVSMASQARGDWPTDSSITKWVQLPDPTELGLDVKVSEPKILADDFKCRMTGPITDIHIWGSWLNDYMPVDATGAPDPSQVVFKLSFHTDIPADPPNGYSRPGQPLWRKFYEPGTYKARVVESVPYEGFFDPNINDVIGKDNLIWQYNFDVPVAEAFVQKEGTIYWLDVQALTRSPNFMFGWKSSRDHWNDDAVFADAPFGAEPTFWKELRYPPGHPMAGQSIDLAFALTTVPEPASLGMLAVAALALGLRRR